jgi:chromosome segregation ATPase
MSAVHPPSNPSAANSDSSVSKSSWLRTELQAERVFETLNEGMPIPSAFIRNEIARMIQREQEKAVALLETSPLLSYLFFTYVISAKETPDSPVSDHSEELSALKLRSEKLESELAAAQAALTEAHDLVETLREEVQQLRADTIEDRSREAAVLEENEKEKEDLRKEARTYKVRKDQGTCPSVSRRSDFDLLQSEVDALRRTMANQQLETTRTNQQRIADNAALQTRFNELQVSKS